MGWRDKTFRTTRRKALRKWLGDSKRSREKGCSDTFSGALECQWQARVEHGKHCALFCGIGEWANHITDVLTDLSCDNLRFDDETHANRLARQYARLMFAVAELLNDFEVALNNIKEQGDIRAKLGNRVKDIQAFVNQVVKHKAKGLHKHDHHLPIAFQDAGGSTCDKVIQLGTKDFTGKNNFDCIVLPTLSEVLDVAIGAYRAFDEILKDRSKFNQIVNGYDIIIGETS